MTVHPMRLIDSLVNLVSGLGTSRDKAAADSYGFTPMSQAQLNNAYRGNWIARKIVDCPPFDSVREWRNWQAEGADIEALEETERVFGVRRQVQRAMSRGRLYGGAIALMGFRDGDPGTELDVEAIRKDSLVWIHVVPRWELSTGQPIRDVMSEFYGQPEYYEVRGKDIQVRIHPSRCIPFYGAELPEDQLRGDVWSDSVLDPVNRAVLDATLGSSAIASLLHEAKIDVIRIPNLMENLATQEYTNALISRFQLAATTKAINGALILDKEEEYEQKQIAFAQLPEALQVFLQIAAGAADIPATRLLGQSPKGMNATGESDTRNYYDKISAEQELCLRPALSRLDEVLLRTTFGTRPEDIYYEWAPLWQLDEVQRADVEKKMAETSQIYVNSGLVPAPALAEATVNRLIETAAYPGLEAAIEETGADPAADMEAALEEQKEVEAQEREASVAALLAKAEGGATRVADARAAAVRRRRRGRKRYPY